MAAIGLNTNIMKLVKTGGKPIILGLCCWVGITAVSLILQHVLVSGKPFKIHNGRYRPIVLLSEEADYILRCALLCRVRLFLSVRR